MQQTLHHAPFPDLTWDEFCWSGPVQLSAWTGFEAWRGPWGVRSSHGSTDGTVDIRIWPQDDVPTHPTPAQAAAYHYLLAHQAKIRDEVLAALQAKYTSWLVKYEEPGTGAPMPIVLQRLLGLTGINIFSTEKNGMAYVGYELCCGWEEHGLGAMTYADNIVKVDGAKTAIMEIVAMQDLKSQPQ